MEHNANGSFLFTSCPIHLNHSLVGSPLSRLRFKDSTKALLGSVPPMIEANGFNVGSVEPGGVNLDFLDKTVES